MPTTKYDAKYGGFWNRFVACLIDLVLIGVIIFIVVDVVYHVLGGSDIVAGGTIENVLSFLFLILDWLYFAIMESS
ncbi:MAG: RDD family protein, partial [Trichodesmium sp. St16_bin2-tuft]|nr:RDD family protein [Trichodesmium sp. St16_bin2-tuft]